MNRNRDEVHGFTIPELERLEHVIERSWDRIAGDMFYNDEGVFDESILHSQAVVAEVALDADRWRDICSDDEIESTHALVKKFYMLEHNEQEEVLNNTLRYKIYGC